MSVYNFQINFLIRKVARFNKKAAWISYLNKVAQSQNLLSELNEYVDSVKNEGLFNKVSSLAENYQAFLEELSPDNLNKDLSKAGSYAEKAQEDLNDISTDSYINTSKDGFFQEDEDFDPNKFLSLLEKVSNDIVNKLDDIGDVEEYDEAAEIKLQIMDILAAAKQYPEFSKALESGINNAVKYLKEKNPEIVKMMGEIENINQLSAKDWKEIQEDLSNITADKFNTQNTRIFDYEKQKQKMREYSKDRIQEIKSLKKINPNHEKVIRYLEAQRRGWENIKNDPTKYAEYKSKKNKSRKDFFDKLTEKAKTDPVAAERLKTLRQKENEKVTKFWHTNEYMALINKYRNLFVNAAIRDFSIKIARQVMNSNPDILIELQSLPADKREEFKKEKIKNISKKMITDKDPQIVAWVKNLHNQVSQNPKFIEINNKDPHAGETIINSVKYLERKFGIG